MSEGVRNPIAILGRHPPADPYPVYERLLAAGPLAWSEYAGRWTVLGYMAAREVLRDDTFLADDALRTMIPRLAAGTGHEFAALRQLHDCIAFFLDPPAHGPVRQLLTKLMRNRPAAGLRRATEALVARELQRAKREGGFDLVLDFARKITGGAMALVLGVPEDDLSALSRASEEFSEVFDALLPIRSFRRIDDAAKRLIDYFMELVRKRRRTPEEDGISYIIHEANEGARFSDADLAGFCAFMYSAGQETTASFLAGGGAVLLQNAAAMVELRDDPAKLPRAADDLLRHHSPVQVIARVASADRVVAGQTIVAGKRVAIFLGAANRDASIYPAQPCPFLDHDRPPHLAFGDGRHFCLGAPMARMEGMAAFAGLLTLPQPRLALDEADWADRRNLRALAKMPVLL
jgi:pimeloyl-[acyl-carrier protein] synthase